MQRNGSMLRFSAVCGGGAGDAGCSQKAKTAAAKMLPQPIFCSHNSYRRAFYPKAGGNPHEQVS